MKFAHRLAAAHFVLERDVSLVAQIIILVQKAKSW
jgi:hypothetical protein